MNFVKRSSQRTHIVHQLQPPGGEDTIAQFYDLTTAERRVLSAILDSGNVRSVAIALGVGEATIKTHLQHIFGKTGVRRQIDLVKLVIAGVTEPRSRRLQL
jgi:DNA-binding NarL/FixJ family response regulator